MFSEFSKTPFNLVFFKVLILICCSGLAIEAQTNLLKPGKPLSIKNSQINSQSFKIEAQKQQVIALEIKQNGVDVRVKLFDTKGLQIAESDYPFSEQDIERIFVIANEDGVYRLETVSKFPDENGSIEIKLNELRKALPDDFKHAEAENLFSQAQALRTTGKTADRQKAIEIFEKSLILWREIDDEIGQLRTLANLSYLYRLINNDEKSEQIAKGILTTADLKEYKTYKSDALYQLGQVEFNNGQINQAIDTFKASLAMFPQPSPKQVNILTTLGYAYQSIDEFETAQKFFEDALLNVRQFSDRYNEAQIHHLIGLFYFNSNEYKSAAEHFSLAADLRQTFGNRRGQAISLTFLGMTYQAMKDFPKSLEVLEKALPISRELGDIENQLDTLIYLALANRALGNFEKALELYKQAQSVWGDKNPPSSLFLSLGVTYRELANFAESRRNFEKSLLLYRRIGDIGGEATTLYQFALLELTENKPDEAKIKIERALQIHEYEQAKYKDFRRLTNFLEMRRRYFDLYVDVLMSLNTQKTNENFAFKALQASESARMRTLIWQLREALKNNPQTVDYQIITDMQKVQQQIGEQLSLLAKAQSKADQKDNISTIERRINELNKQLESLKADLRQSNPNVAALAQPPTLSLAQMQAELDDESVLVEYSLGEQRSYLWIVGKNSFQSFVLPKRAEIETQAKTVYDILSQTETLPGERTDKNNLKIKAANKLNISEESAKLSQMLAVEKFTDLSAKRLIFVNDGALNYIPFASLSYQNGFLTDKFEIVQLPSLTTLHILRQRNLKPFAPESVAVIADPIFSLNDERLGKNKVKNKSAAVSDDLAATLRDFSLTGLSRLPFTRREAQKIAENAPSETNLNLDFKADRQRILNGDFDRFDVLHFATHGFLNSEHPELSGLVLSLVDEKGVSQNGFLRTQDLFLLKLNAQMVVLSACQTGLGKQVGNEGLIGLTRGFLANGTPRIISTLWKVDDSATAEFMSRFYRALLKENQVPSAALKTAQNELKSIPRYAHPRYWAGFVLTGEWR